MNLDDYVPVDERIADFREKYPDGRLQPLNLDEPFRLVTLGEGDRQTTYVVVTAAAYRTPDDPRPGVGSAWELWPGKTSFTRDSELMNAETSAWGRALIAVLSADSKRGIASRDEVRNRTAEREKPAADTASAEQRERFENLAGRIRRAENEVELGPVWFDINADVKAQRLTETQGHKLQALWKARKAKVGEKP